MERKITSAAGIWIHYMVILLVGEMLTQTSAFMTSDDTPEHKRIIIHVPVVTRTIYKIIDKGHHHQRQPPSQKYANEVIHHHHHGGHVAHIHKHEGGAGHQHHHVGSAGHAHKHTGLAGHKHAHAGKAQHAHLHHGHAAHEHLHKGLYGHEHKHLGAFTGSHAHAGSGLHGHAHYPTGVTGHEAFAALGINPVGYLGLSFDSPHPPPAHQQPHQTDWVAIPTPSQPSVYPNYVAPFAPTWSPQYAPYATYFHQDDFKPKPPPPPLRPSPTYTAYTPESANQYTGVKGGHQSGVTTTQNSKQVVKSEYEETPNEGKKPTKVTRTKFHSDLFAPALPPLPPPPPAPLQLLTNEVEDTAQTMQHNFDDFTESLEDNVMSTMVPEYESQEFVGFDEAMSAESEEGGEGAFQSPIKARIPFSKRLKPSSFVMPVMLPYEVTEITPYL